MVTEHWHRLAREAVESPCMKTLKSYLDVVLGGLLSVTLLEQGVGPDASRNLFQPQTFCDSVRERFLSALC